MWYTNQCGVVSDKVILRVTSRVKDYLESLYGMSKCSTIHLIVSNHPRVQLEVKVDELNHRALASIEQAPCLLCVKLTLSFPGTDGVEIFKPAA